MPYLLSALFTLAMFMGSPAPLSASEPAPTPAHLQCSVQKIQPGKPFWVLLTLDIDPNWHSYWINPGDSGLATTLEWTLPPEFKTSAIYWPPPEIRKKDGGIHYVFHEKAHHLVQITPPADLPLTRPVTLKLKANWLLCGNSCMPEESLLSLTLPVGTQEEPSVSAAHIQRIQMTLPKKHTALGVYQHVDKQIYLHIPKSSLPKGVISLEFLPFKQGVINAHIPQLLEKKSGDYVLKITQGKTEPDPSLRGLLYITESANGEKYKTTIVTLKADKDMVGLSQNGNITLWYTLLFAFLGGLILNTMPCVFPILSLKTLSLSRKSGKDRPHILKEGWAYTSGVVCCFLMLAGILLILRYGGQSIGWGFQMQSPLFVSLMIYLMFLIGLSLSGVFYLPVLFGSAGEGLGNASSFSSNFIVGSLAVLVATPCTAPFMGVAIGYALSQSPLAVIAIFIMLGVGFASPYLLACLWPTLLKWMPKPGAWMEIFKELLAFPMYATVVWLMWVLVQQTGPTSLLYIGAGLVFLTFAVWCTGRFMPRQRLLKLGVFGGLWGLCCWPLYEIYAQKPTVPLSSSQPFSVDTLFSLIKAKKPVFVTATAAWCLTCKVNENLFNRPAIQTLMKEKEITYLEADWTNHNEEITHFLDRFGRQGVPLYVYYPVNGAPKILPQLLTEGIILDYLQEK